MQAKNIPTNQCQTGTEQNLAAAAVEETLPAAQWKFRCLEYANDRGTGGDQFDRLALLFQARQKLLELIRK